MRGSKRRAEMHKAINSLSHAEVAKMVLGFLPKTKTDKIDEIAKKVIAKAHELIKK
jgi:hypothetical protein